MSFQSRIIEGKFRIINDIGKGYGVRYIGKKDIPAKTSILQFEYDEIIDMMKENGDEISMDEVEEMFPGKYIMDLNYESWGVIKDDCLANKINHVQEDLCNCYISENGIDVKTNIVIKQNTILSLNYGRNNWVLKLNRANDIIEKYKEEIKGKRFQCEVSGKFMNKKDVLQKKLDEDEEYQELFI